MNYSPESDERMLSTAYNYHLYILHLLNIQSTLFLNE
jgi:hypothetical protein